MLSDDHQAQAPTRRAFLALLAASTVLAATGSAFGQGAEAPVAGQAQTAFSFDWLTSEMRRRSTEPHREPAQLGEPYSLLDYDDYRRIQFNPKMARWNDKQSLFQLHAFHPGWLYKETVELFEINEGMATPIGFTTDDFLYYDGMKTEMPEHMALPGIVGFRLNHPLNTLDKYDELLAFVGASYFRALGRGNAYGMSARGLAINTGLSNTEEFPRFTAFWIERPADLSGQVVINAALESPSVTGAYRFVVTPGDDTVMDVTSRLFFRNAVEQLGVAPLTSMFLYGQANRHEFDDFRPQVHDSDGLMLERSGNDRLWRALANPPRLGSSYFSEPELKAFGLYQRARDFDDYQDIGAHYQDRPSLRVEMLGQWPEGSVRLVEIPAEIEADDNIAAFWVPKAAPKAGDALEFQYRLHWGALAPDPSDDLAYVDATRGGVGGVAGVRDKDPNIRKFVVDFRDGMLGDLDAEADVEIMVTTSKGEAENVVLSKIPDTKIWRLSFDLNGTDEAILELSAHVAGYGRKLSEVWLYQWMREQ